MENYTLEEVIEAINSELEEAYESAIDSIDDTDESCDECVESVVEAYEDGVISYEAAEEYIDIITEARRLDKEILKRKELLDRYDKIAKDPDIPKSLKDKLYDKVASQTELRAPGRRYLSRNPAERHDKIKDAVERRRRFSDNDHTFSYLLLKDKLRPARERKPGKYLELQKKLNNSKTGLTLPKKVDTKVSKDDYEGLF